VKVDLLDVIPPQVALRDRVCDRLEELIVSGALPPGMRLVETDLAQRLSVSRGPVREALQQLARDRFVDIHPRQGSFVHVPTSQEINDFFDVRRALELEATKLATERITDAAAQKLRSWVRSGKTAIKSGRDPFMDTLPVGLHEEILVIASNELLAELLRTLHRRVKWYLARLGPDLGHQSWREHAKIADALASRDAQGATAAMVEHLDRARATYLACLEERDSGARTF
jgi:DNA-binding GntR family transcriptional regulator